MVSMSLWQIIEAAIAGALQKKVFLKNLQISQKRPVSEYRFNEFKNTYVEEHPLAAISQIKEHWQNYNCD